MVQERLKIRRQEIGFKQAELARIIGVGRDSYNKYERSGVNPSLEVLARLADALQTSTDYLLGSTDNPAPPFQKPYGEVDAFESTDEVCPSEVGTESVVSENLHNKYQAGTQRAVIQLDSAELSLIIDYRDIDEDSKSDLSKMAKTLAENTRLKRMLNTDR
jgi:transcriptional regulator with XRE-family HTH domain